MRRPSPTRPHLRRSLLLTCAFALGGCGTTVSAIHSPLYSPVRHTSTIEARATNTQMGIRRIVLTVTTGEMADCSVIDDILGQDSVIPCRRNANVVQFTCDFDGRPATATCTFSQDLGDGALVSYQAEAQPVVGRAVRSKAITYSGGFPFPEDLARPVLWHRAEPFGSKIDLGFFPDRDYLRDYLRFTQDLESLAKAVFFNDQDFAQVYTIFRSSFNLWAAPFGADAESCARTYDPLSRRIAAVLDGEAIVHTAIFRDCASLGLGGSGSVQAGIGGDFTLVHESGHFLHGQGDEYCCDGGYGFAGPCGNVFPNEPACQAAASAANLPPEDCVEIGVGPSATGKWRNFDGRSLEIMADNNPRSNWRDNSNRCVIGRFALCGGGSCY